MARLADLRLWLIAAALALNALVFIVPRVKLHRNAYDVVAFADITGSMNTRDKEAGGTAQSRFRAVQAALRTLLADLPSQSRLGLGVFAERRSFLLFNPVEVCENFAPIDTSISDLDWRMGWEGDSYVAKGLHSALAIAADLSADIVFLTDGHEAPPLPPGAGLPEFEGVRERVKGLIVGVGGKGKSAIPKFDDDGREIGTYGPQDVPQENRSGAPPKDAESRPGYHPKWAPFGSAQAEGDEHLSSVRTDHLRALAAQTGLAYFELTDTPDLLQALGEHARPRAVTVDADTRPIPAGLALMLLGALYGIPLMSRLRAKLETGRRPRTSPQRPATG